jgi:class 3 adenylate cyclase
MFCDLVDSTGIAARLDAEEWRDLVNAYLDGASAAVTEIGGCVAKKLGDGLMALFGYPLAHENDAERAARAALSIQRALGDLNRKNAGAGKPELVARIGLETGPAVVDAAGEIYGDVTNIAARVQALAEPGAVLITARVQRQVAGLFVVEERGCHQLKGVPEPVTLFRLIRASGGGRRSGMRQLTPFGNLPRRSMTRPSDSPFITVCLPAPSCAPSWSLRERLPRHFCARLNAEHGRRSVGLAAA